MTADPHDPGPEDQDQPAEPEPADEPEDEPAHRPGVADALATLAAYRAILNGASPAETHDQAEGGSCPACATVAAAGFGNMVAEKLAAGLVRKLAPGAVLDIRMIRAAILDVIGEAEAELRRSAN